MFRLVVLLFVAVLFGCNSNDSSTVPSNADSEIDGVGMNNVEYKNISTKNSLSGSGVFATKRIEIFRDQESAIDSLLNFEENITAINDTNFKQKQVALVSMGARSSSGYSVNIDSVNSFENYILIEIVYSHPGEGCLGTAAFEEPYVFVEINSTSELLVQERITVTDCI